MSGVFRKQYRQLSAAEQQQVADIKEIAEQLHAKLHNAVGQDGAREMALARTKLEECVMWAVKGVTG